MSARPGAVVALGLLVGLGLAGCTSGTGAAASGTSSDPVLTLPVPAAVTVDVRTLAGLGPVLVDGTGRTLYMFPPDARSHVACTGPCAGTWPPLVVAAGGRTTVRGGADATALGTLPDPNTGARVVTYNGFPLYRYAGDVAAGTAQGQALFVDGGPWYALTAAGDPLTTTPAGTGG